MVVTQVAYEVEGWGVGELWLEGARVVWHDLPFPRADDAEWRPAASSSSGCARTSTARRTAFEDVDLDLEYETPFLERCAQELRAIPRGEVVTYGELAALAGSPGAARAAGSFCARNRLGLFVPCHRVVSAGGLGSYGSYGLALQAAPTGARGCHSLRSSATSSRRSRRMRTAIASPSSPGLFHVAGSVHLRGRGEVALHLDLTSPAVARRAFALLRAFDVESEIRTYQQHAFDRATRYQLHVEGTPHAYETLHRAGVLDASHRPLEHPPQRVLVAHAAAGAPISGVRCSARGR